MERTADKFCGCVGKSMQVIIVMSMSTEQEGCVRFYHRFEQEYTFERVGQGEVKQLRPSIYGYMRAKDLHIPVISCIVHQLIQLLFPQTQVPCIKKIE